MCRSDRRSTEDGGTPPHPLHRPAHRPPRVLHARTPVIPSPCGQPASRAVSVTPTFAPRWVCRRGRLPAVVVRPPVSVAVPRVTPVTTVGRTRHPLWSEGALGEHHRAGAGGRPGPARAAPGQRRGRLG